MPQPARRGVRARQWRGITQHAQDAKALMQQPLARVQLGAQALDIGGQERDQGLARAKARVLQAFDQEGAVGRQAQHFQLAQRGDQLVDGRGAERVGRTEHDVLVLGHDAGRITDRVHDHDKIDKIRGTVYEPIAVSTRTEPLKVEASIGVATVKAGDDYTATDLLLARVGRAGVEAADAIAPVPLHPMRLIARRHNQAAEFARPLA